MDAPNPHAEPATPNLGAPHGGWRDLFAEGRASAVIVLACGVLLYAMNLYFTAALMPSIITDIGGRAFYAWVTTAFVLAAIAASLFVSRLLAQSGAAKTYMLAFATFAAGAVACALSPNMEVFILARVMQGFGGGLLAGLGYAVIRAVLPNRLWIRASALVSGMWGVGTLIGPSLGGAFAEFHAWRWAYGALAAAAALLIYVASRALRAGGFASAQRTPIPIPSLLAIMLACFAISLSAVLPRGWPTVGVTLFGVALLGLFVLIERRAQHTILPAVTYKPHNALKWIYLTSAMLCAGVMIEAFVPLFGQHLGGLTPLLAGMLGSVLSLGWASAQFVVASVQNPALRNVSIRSGPILLTLGLILYGLMQSEQPSGGLILAWAAALFLAGAGIGIAYSLLSVAAMSSSDDPVEGGKAAAGMATTQLIAYSVASACAGALFMLGDASLLAAAHYLAFGLAGLTAIGALTAHLAASALKTA